MVEPEGPSYLRLVIAMIAVLGLLGGLGFILKYMNARGLTLPGRLNAGRRLSLVESLSLDARRRLVIARCDGREHLLLLGATQDIVVDANLPAPTPAPTSAPIKTEKA